MPSQLRFSPRRVLATALSVLAVAAGVGTAGVVLAAPAQAEVYSEVSLLSLLNDERASRGLPALQSASDLVSTARYQSNRMASTRELFHNPDLTSMVTNWLSVGENVGYGGSASQVHNALMNSAPHRANILSTNFRQVGLGTAYDGSGRLWVTQVFRKPTTSLATATAPVGRTPIGSLDAVSTGIGTVTIRGWALDQDTSSSIPAHVYVDGRGLRALTADQPRSDIGRLFGRGDQHGYSYTTVLPEGRHTVCVYAINAAGTAGGNANIGCRAVTVRHTPFGALDSVTDGPDGVTVRGWAVDPDTTASLSTHVYVDGRAVRAVAADNPRSDIARLFGRGDLHGYSTTLPLSDGRHTVCVYAINAGGTQGNNPRLGCRAVSVRHNPFGALDSVTGGSGAITVRGWAIDPDTTAAVDIHTYVDGVRVAVATASAARSDIGRIYPAYGSAHGYSDRVPATRGVHTVCTYALNASGTLGDNPRLGCRSVTV